jgi:hypothetical protein
MGIGSPRIRPRILLFAALLTSCSGPPGAPEYSVGFYNDTPGELTETRADWRVNGIAHHDEAGVLSPGAEKASDEQPRPIPERATVTWRTADGKAHSKDVEVAKLIGDPSSFSGTVYFKFMADGNVAAVPLTYAQERQAAEHGKSALRDGAQGQQPKEK